MVMCFCPNLGTAGTWWNTYKPSSGTLTIVFRLSMPAANYTEVRNQLLQSSAWEPEFRGSTSGTMGKPMFCKSLEKLERHRVHIFESFAPASWGLYVSLGRS